MKNTNQKPLVNIALGYIKVVVIIFPFLVLLKFLLSVISYNFNNDSNFLLKADVLNIFVNIGRYYAESLIKAKGIPVITVVSIFLSNFFFLSLIYYVLLSLKSFLNNICMEKDLSLENGKILKNISVLILLTFFSVKVLQIITNQIKISDGFGNNLRLLQDFIDIVVLLFDPVIILCVVTYIIGNVIIRGAEIKQENDLTV